MRYQTIKEKIRQNYGNLPGNQKKIADFVIDHFDQIPFRNVQQISQSTGTSVATIVRFAQRIGFSGFSELREEIASTLQGHLQGSALFPLIDQEELARNTLTLVANQEITNINQTLAQIEMANFHLVVDEILKAKRVYTMGLGISNLLCQILAYQLNQVGIDAHPFRHDYSYFSEQLLPLNKNDLIVAFSFPPYSVETIETARIARERGIKLIALTNRDSSPVTPYCLVNLCVRSENMLFTNSFSAISVLINAISTECAVKNKSRAEVTATEIDRMMFAQKNIMS
jgi:DNA-binding MurR/RpiR family transcriptional regulator